MNAPVREPGRWREALFGVTLLGYPRSFRRAYAAELRQTFAEQWREQACGRGLAASLAFWWLLMRDGVVSGSSVRLRRLRGDVETADANTGAGTVAQRRRSVAGRLVDGFGQDGRQTLRALRAQPGAAAAVVLTLALGIGAATAIFSVVDAVLLRPLPFAAPERLVELKRNYAGGGVIDAYDAEHARAIIEESEVFASIAAHARLDGVLTGRGDPQQLRVRAVSPALFATLGRAPWIGRGFTERESGEGARVLLLSYETWTVLGADRGIMGSMLEFDGDRYEVIGVMPPDFRFPTRYAAQAFLPLTPDFRGGGLEQTRISMVARLRAGVTPQLAANRITALLARLPGAATPTSTSAWTADVVSLGEWRINPNGRKALLLVAGAVALMLLIAIMNATNLLLTRVSVRAREFAVRHSLGASTARLLRQLVTESLSLALIAGAAAVLMSMAGVRVLMRFAPPDLTDLAAHRVVVDARVLIFTFILTIVTGFLLGVLPAVGATAVARRRIGLSLSPYAATTRERHRVRGGLVIAQVALAMTLLVAAGLLTASFMRIMNVDAGMDLDRTALVMISPNERTYPTRDARRAFAARLEERIAAIPGVESVTRSGSVPPSGSFYISPMLQTEEDAQPRQSSPELLPFAYVRPDFIPTLGTRLYAGRNFTETETPESNVVIIDRDLAQFLWGTMSPIGRRFRTGADTPWLEVAGVIDELMLGGPDNATGEFAVLYPASPALSSSFYAVRARGDANALMAPIRDAIRAIDPNQPVWNLWTARAAVADAVTEQRFFMLLMVVLGTVSAVLSALGLYSLLGFTVSRRTRELGIRMALGARAPSVLRLVVREGLGLALVGVILGLAGALAGARLIRTLLFQVEPGDPAALGAVTLLMLTVALVASAVPAARAARVEPMRVLRSE